MPSRLNPIPSLSTSGAAPPFFESEVLDEGGGSAFAAAGAAAVSGAVGVDEDPPLEAALGCAGDCATSRSAVAASCWRRSSSARAFRSASSKLILAVAFFAPSLAGRPPDAAVFETPRRFNPAPGVRVGAPELEEVADEMDAVDLREAEVTVRGAAGCTGRAANPTTVGCTTAGFGVGALAGWSQLLKKSSSSLEV